MMEASRSRLLVVKTGGRVAADDRMMGNLAAELVEFQKTGTRVVLVHGGGSTITSLQEHYGITPRFVDGLRQTEPAEMPLVDMALAGAVNKKLVRLLSSCGGRAWGLSGADAGVLIAESRNGNPAVNRTGSIVSVDAAALSLISDNGYLPVLAPVASDSTGLGINVNADEVALAISVQMSAEKLVYISDVAGVLEDGNVIGILTPMQIEEKIQAGVIAGGMIPKTRSSASALSEGVGAVIIGDYSDAGCLHELIEGRRGTVIAGEGI